MTSIQFLVEWAVRSSALILVGALLLAALRVKDPAIRLAAWTAMLAGSLAIPLLREALPQMTVKAPTAVAAMVKARPVMLPRGRGSEATAGPVEVRRSDGARIGRLRSSLDVSVIAVAVYALGAFLLLLRVGIGLFAGLRLLRASQPTGSAADGIEIRESARVPAPLTLGIARPAIVLPANWREWEGPKLEAVLAHERSHVRRLDPAVQLASAIHRALLWHSPLSWFLHQRIVRVAEEASDDAALAAACDRPSYAEILLGFMSGPVGVPMGRYGNPDRRIHRILEGSVLSSGLTRWSAAAVLALGCPLVYVAGAANVPVESPAPPLPVAMEAAPVAAFETPEQTPAPAAKYIEGLGNVVPSGTVTVTSRIEGQLTSIVFQEGATVSAGQLLGTIDPRPHEPAVEEALAQVSRDEALLKNARVNLDRLQGLATAKVVPPTAVNDASAEVAKDEAQLRADQAKVQREQLALSYTKIYSPIDGVAGLRQVDVGNMIHTSDPIVVITQMQPAAVVFTIPEDRVAETVARLRSGAKITVEAWNRDYSRRIAIGRLEAVDNQIDVETGMAKLKAVFENKDGALMSGAFVNARMMM